MSKFFKIYGLRTSGTNWLQWLIENNIKDSVVFRNQLAWKHGNPTNILDWSGDLVKWDDKDNLGLEYPSILNLIKTTKLNNGKSVIDIKDEVETAFNNGNIIHCFIVKHPYTFLHSRLKRGKNLDTEIKDWNDRIKSYFNFEYPAKEIIAYEKLNMQPQFVINHIVKKYNLEATVDFNDTDSNLTHGFVSNGTRSILNETFVEDYKLKFTKEELTKIDSLLDNESLELYNRL